MSFSLSLQAPSFYWEIEVVSYGDSEEDSGPIVSFGFATEAEKRDGAWTNPVGTCLFHKYVHFFTLEIPSLPNCSVLYLIADCHPFVSYLSACGSNGRAVHYNGSSLLQWKSVRLDVSLLPGELGDFMFFCSPCSYCQSRHPYCML